MLAHVLIQAHAIAASQGVAGHRVAEASGGEYVVSEDNAVELVPAQREGGVGQVAESLERDGIHVIASVPVT